MKFKNENLGKKHYNYYPITVSALLIFLFVPKMTLNRLLFSLPCILYTLWILYVFKAPDSHKISNS